MFSAALKLIGTENRNKNGGQGVRKTRVSEWFKRFQGSSLFY
jgi:hypothetical protein